VSAQPGTVAEVREKHPIVVEQPHPKPYYRDQGVILLHGYQTDSQEWPSWSYMTLPWVSEDAVKPLSSVEDYDFRRRGLIKPRRATS